MPTQTAIHLRDASAAKKCWSCGCFRNALDAVDKAIPPQQRPPELDAAVREGRLRLTPTRYDCLGCSTCWPALAMNALHEIPGVDLSDTAACAAEEPRPREGWPPLPGSYTVLRYQAPVAVCALTDADLAAGIARQASSDTAIAGTIQTENLGIERLILNVLANPRLRFLILCGTDSRQAVGHRPGQSLLALAANGLDADGRIIGAQGRRPIVCNLPREAVEHFRKTVRVVDLIGCTDLARILQAAHDCAARDPGPAEPFSPGKRIVPERGFLPRTLALDPAGYFVVYADRARKLLSLEQYRNDGTIQAVVEGEQPAELWTPAIERGWVSRLDHAAYLGRELARAEQALRSDQPYVQDAAPQHLPPASPEPPREGRDPRRTQRFPFRRMFLPLTAFAVTAAFHYGWVGFFPDGDAALACNDCGEGCDATRAALSWPARYLQTQAYWMGFSYALSLAFAAWALRRSWERRSSVAGGAALGSLTLSGLLAFAGCWLVGCCGSPMLPIYLNLLGPAFLPLAKPLVALVTTLSIGGTWFWMRRKERRAAASASCCSSANCC